MENRTIGNKIFRGTIVIVVIGILAKFTSFIAEAIMAAYLGTTYQSDAYYMIASVQAVIYPMMSVGIWNVFLPLYKSHIAKDEKTAAESLTNISLTFFTMISIIVVTLLLIFAPIVVSIIAPGFTGETRKICIKLIRISAPMYIFIIASAVYASILQCHNKFLGSQIREVISHIPTIVAAIFFYKKFGIDVMAIALVVAGILRLLIELPFVTWKYKYTPDFQFKSNEFALMLKRLPSAFISAGVTQINTLVDKAMASSLPIGTISGLNYGHKLTNVFSGLLSSAIATAMYPQMIELISLKKQEELNKLIVKIANIFCVTMIPATFACILFRSEMVAAVFQRGAFDESSTALTSNVFALYCIGLFFIACNTVINNIFYGNGDTKTPMMISLTNLVINVTLNILLIQALGVNGLALATSLSAIVTFFIRIIASKKYIKLNIMEMVITGVKVLLASVVACLIPRIIFWLYPTNKYLILIVSTAIGISIYYAMMRILKVQELNDLINLLKRKFNRA